MKNKSIFTSFNDPYLFDLVEKVDRPFIYIFKLHGIFKLQLFPF
jgi:hypothetical protein